MRPDTGTPRDNDDEEKPGESLRQRAEKRMGEKLQGQHHPIKKEDMKKLIHELQVHQIELEIQNEELVRARDEVEAGLERYTELYDFAPVGYFTLDRTGTIRNVNLTGATLLGMERSHLLKEHFIRFVSDVSRPAFATVFSAVFEHNTKSSCEAELLPGGNPPIHVMIEVKAFNERRECLMVLQDITGRKFMEESLRVSENKSRVLLEQVPAILWSIDKNLRFTSSTGSGLALLNLAPNQVAGMSVYEYFRTGDPDSPGVREHLQALSGNAVTYEQTWAGRVWESRLEPIRNPSGEITGAIGVSFDITARKHAEEDLRKFSEDLERKVIERTGEISDINQKLIAEIAVRVDAEKHLTESLGQKEVLLREIHHRVKNNLQIIISLLNLQSRTITDEKIIAAIRESQHRVKAMALVHEKLYRSTDIEKIGLEGYVGFLGSSLFQFYGMKGKGIVFTTDIPGIFIDINTAIPLGLIINELVTNSLKYAFPGGRTGTVSIRSACKDYTLTLVVGDDGVGIPQDLDWRNATSLGLRLVLSLVGQLRGTIELDRTAGTVFTIVIPVTARAPRMI